MLSASLNKTFPSFLTTVQESASNTFRNGKDNLCNMALCMNGDRVFNLVDDTLVPVADLNSVVYITYKKPHQC